MNNQNKSYIFALIAVLLWSTVATAFKFALEQYDYIQVLFISSGTATLFLLGINIYQSNYTEIIRIKPKELFAISISGFLNPFIYYLILFKAYSLLPAQIAQSLNYTWPIVLVILSSIAFKYKLKFKTYISLLFGLIGVIIISFKGNFFLPSNISILGLILAVGSSVIWSLFWIITSKNKVKSELKLFLSFLIGFILISIVMFSFSEFPQIHFKALFASIYTGLFEMSITFILWQKALELTTRTEKISNIIFLSPFISLLFINIFLNETIFISTFIGLIIIIFGIIIEKYKSN